MAVREEYRLLELAVFTETVIFDAVAVRLTCTKQDCAVELD